MTVATDQRTQTRKQLAERRRMLAPAERMNAARGLRESLEQLPDFLVDERIAGYWATDGELPLNLAIAPLNRRGQQYHLPVVRAERQLGFAAWHSDGPLQPNRYGIPEPVADADALLLPQQLDIVLVPLLGFDREGNRLGFGGGFYDASFSFLGENPRPAQPLLVGVGYAFQELPRIDTQPWDIRLDYVATDAELIDCTGADTDTE